MINQTYHGSFFCSTSGKGSLTVIDCVLETKPSKPDGLIPETL